MYILQSYHLGQMLILPYILENKKKYLINFEYIKAVNKFNIKKGIPNGTPLNVFTTE